MFKKLKKSLNSNIISEILTDDLQLFKMIPKSSFKTIRNYYDITATAMANLY
jgi:hypothetical protein